MAFDVADNGDGTGGVASVSGESPSAVHTLYSLPFDGTPGPVSPETLVGSRTGDGAIPVPVSVGTGTTSGFLFRLESTGGLQRLLLRTFTSGFNPQWDILEGTAAAVRLLGLPGVASVDVTRTWIPRWWDGVDNLPCVRVGPGVSEKILAQTNGSYDVGYPVRVALLSRGNQDYLVQQGQNLLRRDLVLNRFFGRRPASVCGAMPGLFEGGSICDPGAFAKNLHLSVVELRFPVRRIRGS